MFERKSPVEEVFSAAWEQWEGVLVTVSKSQILVGDEKILGLPRL